jgi:hypothetical protein
MLSEDGILTLRSLAREKPDALLPVEIESSLSDDEVVTEEVKAKPVFCLLLARALVSPEHKQGHPRSESGDIDHPALLDLEGSTKASRKSFFRRGQKPLSGVAPSSRTSTAELAESSDKLKPPPLSALKVKAAKKTLGDFSFGLAKMIGVGDKKPDTGAGPGEVRAPSETMPGEVEVLAQLDALVVSNGLEKRRALFGPLLLEDKWHLVREYGKGGDLTTRDWVKTKTSSKGVASILQKLHTDPSLSHIDAVKSFLQSESSLRGVTKFFAQGGPSTLVGVLSSFEGKNRRGVENQDALLLLLECIKLAMCQPLGWIAMCEAGVAVAVAGQFNPAYGVHVRLTAISLLRCMVDHSSVTCAAVVAAWAVRARSNSEKYRFEHLLEALQPGNGFDVSGRLALASFLSGMVSCTQDRAARLALRQELLHRNFKSILSECVAETANVGFEGVLEEFRRLQLVDLHLSSEASLHAVSGGGAGQDGEDPWKRLEASLASDDVMLGLFKSVTGSLGKLGAERATALWKWQAADRLLHLVSECPFQINQEAVTTTTTTAKAPAAPDAPVKPAVPDVSSPESILAALLLGGAVQEEIIELREIVLLQCPFFCFSP